MYSKLQKYLQTSNDSFSRYPNLYIIVRRQEGYTRTHNFILIVSNDSVCKAVHYKVQSFESTARLISSNNAKLANLIELIEHPDEPQWYPEDYVTFSRVQNNNIHSTLLIQRDSLLDDAFKKFLYNEKSMKPSWF